MRSKITLAATLAALLLATLAATPATATAAPNPLQIETIGFWHGWAAPNFIGPRITYGPTTFCFPTLAPLSSAENPPDSHLTVTLYWVPGCPSWAPTATLHPGDTQHWITPPAVSYRAT